MLKILIFHNIRGIPKDARTLLKTPKTHVVTEIAGGSYWHNGIETNLIHIYSGDRNKPKEMELIFNIDGVPISRSSQSQLWPISGRIYDSEHDPFFIGIFHGYTKPKDANEYLSKFVSELNHLLEHGMIIDGEHISIKCRCFVCDAPAKSFIRCSA